MLCLWCEQCTNYSGIVQKMLNIVYQTHLVARTNLWSPFNWFIAVTMSQRLRVCNVKTSQCFESESWIYFERFYTLKEFKFVEEKFLHFINKTAIFKRKMDRIPWLLNHVGGYLSLAGSLGIVDTTFIIANLFSYSMSSKPRNEPKLPSISCFWCQWELLRVI